MVSLAMLGVGHSLRMATAGGGGGGTQLRAEYGSTEWWIAAAISVVLVLFVGIMFGLTLGLMSLGLVDLEVLQQSGSEEGKKQASEPLDPCPELQLSSFGKCLVFLILVVCS